ncbi:MULTISPECIES: hypothetical protein [Mycobacteriaceae]|uniref:Uncharacterized protein n=1 Tax=Mycolicibacterium parafortuitum TaxID=39692 RepID=A0ACC6MKI1_MYCPF|nr:MULTISPECIES: hypothetical protein [Mycobacteriaceae]MDZ5087497.1 hypothetical protein [Mycolicibacterium parafortuitum]MEC9322588.1 hypothetical protein [Actinomycetota bacterium]GFM18191.1 peptide synthetase 2 [Mycobacterium sp. PO1]GFM24037.1 peptide synthetase 2 [Mycobacterium sp. PO2]
MVAPYMADEVRNTLVASAPESLVVVDHAAADGEARQFENVVTPPSSELSAELDSSAEWLGVTVEEILLAALGRTFGRTRGDGAVVVDVAAGQPGLCRRVSLLCAAGAPMGPTEMLQGAHNSLIAASSHPDARAEILLDVTGAGATGQSPRALELRVARQSDDLHIQWCYDPSRLDRYSVEEMAEQFPLALIEITSDAAAPL